MKNMNFQRHNFSKKIVISKLSLEKSHLKYNFLRSLQKWSLITLQRHDQFQTDFTAPTFTLVRTV